VDPKPLQIVRAALGYPAQAMFAAGGILPRHQTQPGRELAPTAEAARFYHRGGDGCGDDRADAWNARQALADGVALVPVHQLLLDQQLEAVPHFFRNCLHCEQFLRESEHPNGLPIWTLPLHGGARPQAFSRVLIAPITASPLLAPVTMIRERIEEGLNPRSALGWRPEGDPKLEVIKMPRPRERRRSNPLGYDSRAFSTGSNIGPA